MIHPACGAAPHHEHPWVHKKRKSKASISLLPSQPPGPGGDATSCLTFLLPACPTMTAVPSSAEPTDSCVCILIGAHESYESSHVSGLAQACLCARGQVSECVPSQVFHVVVQAWLVQAHRGAFRLLCMLRTPGLLQPQSWPAQRAAPGKISKCL